MCSTCCQPMCLLQAVDSRQCKKLLKPWAEKLDRLHCWTDPWGHIFLQTHHASVVYSIVYLVVLLIHTYPLWQWIHEHFSVHATEIAPTPNTAIGHNLCSQCGWKSIPADGYSPNTIVAIVPGSLAGATNATSGDKVIANRGLEVAG